MATISNNDIARAIYLVSKDKNRSEQADISGKVASFLFRKKLLARAPQILSLLKKTVNKEEGRVEAKVSSIQKLDSKTKTSLEQSLKIRYGAKEVILHESIDEKLVGGVKIEVNDEVMDLSVKNKIGKLQEYLTTSV